jgi:hypothetical protein
VAGALYTTYDIYCHFLRYLSKLPLTALENVARYLLFSFNKNISLGRAKQKFATRPSTSILPSKLPPSAQFRVVSLEKIGEVMGVCSISQRIPPWATLRELHLYNEDRQISS